MRSMSVADHRQRLSRIGQLPAHQHHQAKAEEQEDQPGDPVLDADHLVIGRDDVFFPEWQLVVVVRVVMMRDRALACETEEEASINGNLTLSIGRNFSRGKPQKMISARRRAARQAEESIDGRKQQKDFLRSQSAARFAIPAR